MNDLPAVGDEVENNGRRKSVAATPQAAHARCNAANSASTSGRSLS
jgi:hypothetical protein